MKNKVLFSLFLLISISAYQTSISTREKTKELSIIKETLRVERNRKNVLIADWAYLNRLERLEKLSNKHLNLTSIKPSQTLTFSADNKSINFSNLGFKQKLALATPSKKPKKLT
ncbi:MAG: hypothetical protein OIF36_03665 [Alphaproteobacteria bacterium]|jgi:hypothetical protein|nr:hypothetical protein [Alphaproteobacteria bacterium]MCV6599558.1 hypothetical protein [Alphaproteobacteria bacterium]